MAKQCGCTSQTGFFEVAPTKLRSSLATPLNLPQTFKETTVFFCWNVLKFETLIVIINLIHHQNSFQMKLFMVDSHQQTAILLLVGEITRVVIKTYFSVKKLCIILSHHYNVQVFKY